MALPARCPSPRFLQSAIHRVRCSTSRPLLPMIMMENVNQTVAGRRYNSSASSFSSTTAVHQLTHIGADGRPAMVNVSEKTPTKRKATASGRIYIPAVAYDLITGVSETQRINTNAAERQQAGEEAIEKARAKAKGKGDVLTVAQLAAIMGSKRTSDLIPLCHPLALSHVSVELRPRVHKNASGYDGDDSNVFGSDNQEYHHQHQQEVRYSIECEATVACEGKTGVEMEALTAVSVGLLTVWDMLKAVAGKEMKICDIMVIRKEGGKSGDFIRTE
jgi:molybdenum cofactor biosynthesis enzyme